MTALNRLLMLPAFLLLTITLTTMLTSCGGGGSGDLPPERPAGQITGYAIDSAISGGTVSVYSFANGVRGEKLGSATADTSTGAFSVTIRAASQVVLVEVSGGSYIEEGSGTEVTLADGQTLRSLVQYDSGQGVNTNITPLTHMATALAQYHIAQGVAVGQAMMDAFTVIDDFFGVDSRGVTSINISKGTLDQTTLDPDVLYGFYMAGLSSWSAWINQQNGHPAHSTYTSMGLSQLMYDDIRYDGLLDGVAANNDGSGPMNLALEKVALNADAYRLAFSLHVIAAAKGTQNKTGISGDNQELLAAANKLAGQDGSSPLLAEGTAPLVLGDQPIAVSVDPAYYTGLVGGQYSFPVTVDSLVGAETISIALDQASNIVQTLGSLDAPVAHLDLSAQPSGTHTLYVSAVNIFGTSTTTPFSFNVTLDSDAPTVMVTSEPYASSASMTITGTYQDTGGAGVQSVDVVVGTDTTTATLDDPAPGQWTATVTTLAKGNNPIKVVATDNVGNVFENSQFQVYLDDIAPLIGNADPTSTHSQAKFSSGGGAYTQRALLTEDTVEPLYIETTNRVFNSSADPTNLDNNGIPYFKFTVSDERAPGDATKPQAIVVEMQYAKTPGGSGSPQTIDDWHVLNRYQPCDNLVTMCEYYVPLAAPFLNAAWDQSTPLDTQIINVRVTDTAGNETTAQFSFRADFYVPPIPVCADQLCTAGELVVNDLDPFTGADFATRDTSLYKVPLNTTTYSFTNPSDESIYIHIAEPPNTEHTVTQLQEQYVRKHHIQHTHETQWLVNPMNPLTTCPTAATWYTVGVNVLLYNWDGSQLSPITPPAATVEEYDWPSDTLPANASQTADAADPDTALYHGTFTVGHNQTDYDADYEVEDFANTFLGYASVANWITVNTINQNTTTCPDQRYFQETVNDNYTTLVAPTNSTQDVSPGINAVFNTDTYTVMADQVEVLPLSGGWYAIPAGAKVDITKTVRTDTTPALVFKEDSFSGDATYTAPFPTRDKSLTWLIDRKLTIYAIHNTGEANISAMSQRQTDSNTGAKQYVTARP